MKVVVFFVCNLRCCNHGIEAALVSGAVVEEIRFCACPESGLLSMSIDIFSVTDSLDFCPFYPPTLLKPHIIYPFSLVVVVIVVEVPLSCVSRI